MAQPRDWPQPSDYLEAIQSPHVAFTDAGLRTAIVRTDQLGLPEAATGRSAVVVRASVRSSDAALRFFTRSASGQRQRYRELHAHLAPSPPPYFVDFAYRDKEVLVKGARYPMVEMAWADGQPLNIWLGTHIRRPGDIAALAASWLGLVTDMRGRDLAHGDLSNDNCLVSGTAFRLIDYDGCFIPALADSPPGEAGDPHFQHPGRQGHYALNIDSFPSLVIYLSLAVLGSDPSLWRFHTGENLIFSAHDYLEPGKTPVWKALAKISDPRMSALVMQLADMCRAPVESLPSLPDAISAAPARRITTGPQPAWWQTAPAPAGRRSSPAQPWWQTAQPDGTSTGAGAQGSGTWWEDQILEGQPVEPWSRPALQRPPIGTRIISPLGHALTTSSSPARATAGRLAAGSLLLLLVVILVIVLA